MSAVGPGFTAAGGLRSPGAGSALDTAERLLAVGQLSEASALLDRDRAQFGCVPRFWSLAGRIALRSGGVASALANFRRSIALDPGHAGSYGNLALALRRLGAEGEAAAALTVGLGAAPNVAGLHVNLGNLLVKTDPRAAIRHYRRGAVLIPGAGTPWAGLGTALRETAQFEAADSALGLAVALEPHQLEPRLNWGAIALDVGRWQAVCDRLAPVADHPMAMQSRGIALLELGQPEAAERLLGALPPTPVILLHRARARSALQDRDGAESLLAEALRLAPADAMLWRVLGELRAGTGERRRDIVRLRRALALQPGSSDLFFALGIAVQESGAPLEAIPLYRLALANGPEKPDVLSNLGTALSDADLNIEARTLLERGVAEWPMDGAMAVNLATVTLGLGDPERAQRFYRRAIALIPDRPDGYYNFGVLLKKLGRLPDALAVYDRALALDPDDYRIRYNRAQALLQLGRFEEGLKEYVWRWRAPEFPAWRQLFPKPTLPVPVWDGRPADGKSLALWAEQGVGDEVWYLGLTPAIASRVGTLRAEVDRRLVPLIRRSLPSVEPIARKPRPAPAILEADMQLPMGEMPVILGSRRADPGYFQADSELTAELRERYKEGEDLPLVGIAWRSLKPKAERSFEAGLSHWKPLLGMTGVRFVCLQYGDVAQDLADLGDLGKRIIVDEDIDSLIDLDGFAAQVAAMDVVVSIANLTVAMAHALDRPALCLLRCEQDEWRYRHKCTRTPWLPGCYSLWADLESGWDGVISRAETVLGHWRDHRRWPEEG